MSDNNLGLKKEFSVALKDSFVSLATSIYGLRDCVDVAADTMSQKYGEGHHLIVRLRSYYPAIEKALSYLQDMEVLFDGGNLAAIHELTEKIRAISEMIRTDAHDVLLVMSRGFDNVPNSDVWN